MASSKKREKKKMKKFLFAVLFMILGGLLVAVGFGISIDQVTDAVTDAARYEDRISELEDINEEPLEGVMIATGRYFIVYVTFVEGYVTEVKLCNLETGVCELDDEDGQGLDIWYQGEYPWMLMELNAFLVERETAYEAEQALEDGGE